MRGRSCQKELKGRSRQGESGRMKRLQISSHSFLKEGAENMRNKELHRLMETGETKAASGPLAQRVTGLVGGGGSLGNRVSVHRRRVPSAFSQNGRILCCQA